MDSFEDKDGISDRIEEYNATASDGDKIIYTDYGAVNVFSNNNCKCYFLCAYSFL